MINSVLLIGFCFFKCFRMALHSSHPFDFLLIKAKSTSTACTPRIILGKSKSGALQDIQYVGFIYSGLFKRQSYNQVIIFRGVAFPIFFIATNCNIAIYYRSEERRVGKECIMWWVTE